MTRARAVVDLPCPDCEDGIRQALLDAAGGSPLAVTGAGSVSAGALGLGVPALSTARLDEVVALRPRDFTVTVGTGLRLDAVARIAGAEGLWIPAGGSGAARSVGGWVASASPGPWDAFFGPVRRQVLACRIVTPDGRRLSWGRAVVKNVAGYDLPRLVAGSRGRLGVLTQVTLRLWPRPPVLAAVDLAGEAAAVGSAMRAAAGLPGSPGTGGRNESPLVDALSWTWTAGDGYRARAWLAGTAESVRRRLAAIGRLGRAHGLDAEESDPEPREGTDRPLTSAAFRWAPGRRYLPVAIGRLLEESGRALVRLEAFPLTGILMATFERGVAGAGPASVAALDGPRATPMAVERGGPAEHAAIEARRGGEVRALERRVVEALGGTARIWQADYL